MRLSQKYANCPSLSKFTKIGNVNSTSFRIIATKSFIKKLSLEDAMIFFIIITCYFVLIQWCKKRLLRQTYFYTVLNKYRMHIFPCWLVRLLWRWYSSMYSITHVLQLPFPWCMLIISVCCRLFGTPDIIA